MNRRNRGSAARLLLALLVVAVVTACAAGRSEAQTAQSAPDAGNASGVLINELLTHTDPPQVDSVEFYNPTGAAISMAGWWFSDDSKTPDRLTLGADAVVPAQGFWLLELPKPPDGPFELSEMGEEAVLTAVNGNGVPTGYSHSVTFGVAPNGVSLGACRDDGWH